MALHLANKVRMRVGKKRTATQLLGIYLFAVIIGLLGGRIVTAARVYSELGWTAMWAEVGSWGPTAPPKQIRVDYNRSGRT
jgi:hypothetical protein